MFEFAGVGKWAHRAGWDVVIVYQKRPNGESYGVTRRIPAWYTGLWPQVSELCREWWWWQRV
jgi:hypothetical protein